eukprot:295148-Chlamydomonas_euryale.AAC.2
MPVALPTRRAAGSPEESTTPMDARKVVQELNAAWQLLPSEVQSLACATLMDGAGGPASVLWVTCAAMPP